MEDKQTVTYVTYRANSYEFGKAGNRFKVYFEDAADLKKKIEDLKELGLLNEGEIDEG